VAADVAPIQLACPAHAPPALEVDTVANAGHDRVQLPSAAVDDDEDANVNENVDDDDAAAVAAAH